MFIVEKLYQKSELLLETYIPQTVCNCQEYDFLYIILSKLEREENTNTVSHRTCMAAETDECDAKNLYKVWSFLRQLWFLLIEKCTIVGSVTKTSAKRTTKCLQH